MIASRGRRAVVYEASCDTRPMNVAVIGAGKVGTAIAVLLERAGHRIVGISGRAETRRRASSYLPGVPFLEPAAAAAQAELVVIGTPDDVIEQTAEALAAAAAVGPGTSVTHLSGSLGLEVLGAAAQAGARVLAIHPLQTFPDVDSALEGLPGCAIAVTADDETAPSSGSGSPATSAACPSGSRTTSARCITPPPSSRRTIW